MVWPPTSLSSRRQIADFSRSPERLRRRAFRRDCLLKSRATLALVKFTTLLLCSLLSIILTVWLLLALFPSLIRDPLHPGIREEIEQA